MIWDEDRPLALEVDAIYGLTSNPSGGPPLLTDKTVRAVCAWSPRARLLAPAPGTSNATAAEPGIWTHPDFRGRRLAPAVVAAWAGRERRNKDVLFYSTGATNHASQSVARHLGLTPLGWIWTVRQA